MTTAPGMVNKRLDEVLREKLKNYKPGKIHINLASLDIYLPDEGIYAVLVKIDDKRGFIAVYEVNSPEVFLRTQRKCLDEMFACTIETRLEGVVYNG